MMEIVSMHLAMNVYHGEITNHALYLTIQSPVIISDLR
jgi:hypothetical protein